MQFLIAPLMLMWRYRKPLIKSTASDLRGTHAGSVAGLLWIALSPLLLMTIYSVIYLLIFRVRPIDMTSEAYILYIFTGLIPFLGFSVSVTAGTTALATNKDLLVNTVFPAELLPVRTVLASFVPSLVGLAIVLLYAIVMGFASPVMVLSVFVVLMLLMFISGIVWLLSLLNLVMRDIQFILIYINMALLIVSPIAYTESMVPSALKLVIYFNPLSYFIIALHELIVFGRVPSWEILGGVFGLGLFFFGFGYLIFQKAKKVFFDYV